MDTSDIIHLECSRFYFLQLIDTELDGVARHWNEHRIRKNKNVDLPAGNCIFNLKHTCHGTIRCLWMGTSWLLSDNTVKFTSKGRIRGVRRVCWKIIWFMHPQQKMKLPSCLFGLQTSLRESIRPWMNDTLGY